jgi:hypothetical protein
MGIPYSIVLLVPPAHGPLRVSRIRVDHTAEANDFFDVLALLYPYNFETTGLWHVYCYHRVYGLEN